MSTDPAYTYVPRKQPWSGPQHARRGPAGHEAALSVCFFWTTWGEPTIRRVPAGSFPASTVYVPRHSVDVVMPPPDPDATVVAISYMGEPPAGPHELGPIVGPILDYLTTAHTDRLALPGYVVGGSSRAHLQQAGYDYAREEPNA